jgi:hypothetical protein
MHEKRLQATAPGHKNLIKETNPISRNFPKIKIPRTKPQTNRVQEFETGILL